VHKDLEQYLPQLIKQLSANSAGSDLNNRCISVLEQFFSPAILSVCSSEVKQCYLAKDNKTLYIPAIKASPSTAYKLNYATDEDSFIDNDIDLAQTLLKITCQFESVQTAIEQGAHEERQRIARDLHDDVAARLLTLIHKAQDQESIDLARSILKSLRNAIYTLDNKATTTILDALTDVRAEIQDRLNPLGQQLLWGQSEDFSQYIFTPRQHINLQRILHEITTNMIRHAEAQFLNIEIWLSSNQLYIRCCDNGKGFERKNCIPGKGLNNIKNRIDELNGKVSWSANTQNNNQGCCVDLHFPISMPTE